MVRFSDVWIFDESWVGLGRPHGAPERALLGSMRFLAGCNVVIVLSPDGGDTLLAESRVRRAAVNRPDYFGKFHIWSGDF